MKEIFVKGLDKLFSVDASGLHSVDELKGRIIDNGDYNISKDNLLLSFDSLDNLQFNDIVSVRVKLKGGIQIYIKTLSGRQQSLTFEGNASILQVKEALQEKEGIQVDQIRLIFSGKQLADDKTLEFYKVQAGAVIHMVLQLRGGGL